MKLKTSHLLLAAAIQAATVTAAMAETLSVWTTEEQPARLAKQQAVADKFKEKTGIEVKVIPVTEKDLGTRATAAFAAGDLPDVIYHTLQYTLPWADAGILDTEAATDVINNLGKDTFAPGALNMAKYRDGYTAVPADGWTQLIVYRKDLFDANGLEAPTSYAKVIKAIEKLHNPDNGMYGAVVPTKVDENFMSQVLEHVFLANGVSPVGKDGFKPLDEKKTIEALEFYKALAKASPAGELYWKQSRELYFAGKAAVIIWSPFILDELAGLRDDVPPTINDDPQSTELASKTGVVTSFAGPSNEKGAAWGDVRYFGITSDADTEAAEQFIEFSMGDGYTGTLSIAPEGKFPVRRGDKENASKFVEAWTTLPMGVDRQKPLTELYSKELATDLMSGLDVAQRWGVEDGQLATASKIINSQIFNRLVREYIDGVRDAKATVELLNKELAEVK